MRLWHKDLIQALPRQQLLSQYRECVCIARSIAVNGTPNHILVNKIMDYDLNHFYTYTCLVIHEMLERGYKVNADKFKNWFFKIPSASSYFLSSPVSRDDLFASWHNRRYLDQCFYNLQEKYDCGGITKDEYKSLTRDYAFLCNTILKDVTK